MKRFGRLLQYQAICVGTAVIINIWVFSNGGADWARTLLKPAFSPPGPIIGAIWLILFSLLAFSLYFIDTAKHVSARRPTRLAVFIWWGICVSWPIFYFGLQSVKSGFSITLLATISGVVTIFFVARCSIKALIAVMPLQLWLLFAVYLSWNIYALNKSIDVI